MAFDFLHARLYVTATRGPGTLCLMTFYKTVTFPATKRPRLRALFLRLGPDAPLLLDSSRATIQRSLAGLPVRFGSALSIEQALDRLPSSPAALAALVAAARAQHPDAEPTP
jgi:hypothetical protein